MNFKKWIPKVFCRRPDGGKDSGVTAFILIEWKPVFSIVLLRFSEGSRNAYHNHAFNAISWFLSGKVEEQLIDGRKKIYERSWKPKITTRNCVHRVVGIAKKTFCLSFRGPWKDSWKEFKEGEETTLTHGRIPVKEVSDV